MRRYSIIPSKAFCFTVRLASFMVSPLHTGCWNCWHSRRPFRRRVRIPALGCRRWRLAGCVLLLVGADQQRHRDRDVEDARYSLRTAVFMSKLGSTCPGGGVYVSP